ncbi:unnamed protein product [Lymnaea stagnalis]|uniref:Transient receptor potential cation channel subfamily A member 1 n=1 Tax=Lymnaea stagnalis TaxID=6523 RepID=A0AAV2IHV0_LYMST
MIKISFLMVFFLLAMDVPWLVMLNSDGFQENEKSLLSTLAMTIGELNFRDNFIKVDNSPYTLDMFFLFPLFILLMNLSLMNLMIGLAVGDINKVQKKAYLTRLRKQVFYLLELEASTPMRAVKFHIDKAVVRPNEKCQGRWRKMMARFCGAEKIYFMKKKETLDTVEQTTKLIELEMDRQRAKIEELTKTTSATLELVNRLVNSHNSQQQGNSVIARQEVGHI